MTPTPTRTFGPLRRMVVKLGSSTVLSAAFDGLVDQLQDLRDRGIELVVVTSGAVALGMELLELEERPHDLPHVQALAAIGQTRVMNRYTAAFARRGVHCAQVLLTHEALSDRDHFLNVRHTLLAAFALDVVPVANENDTVATEELRFGDNDRLAAALGAVLDADLVVLLSDVDALYERDPRSHPDARPLHEVSVDDDEVHAAAARQGGKLGTGGMVSKVNAARIATEAGIPLVVAHGELPGVLLRLVEGEVIGTRFRSRARTVGRRRHWIGYLSKVRGHVRIDEGAVRALREQGGSLLPIGVRFVTGQFERGDAIRIDGPDDREVARGLVGYDADDLRRIRGLRTDEVARELGVGVADPVVHRNDMVLFTGAEGYEP